jgi:hypothetical protein
MISDGILKSPASLMPSPIIIRISATRSRSMMTNARPNFDSSSSFHCAVIAGRSGHHHKVNAPAQEQFPHDEAGLYRFSQPDIIGNKKIDARQAQRLAERKQLIRVEPDPGAKRRLKEVAVGCRCRVPSDGANVRCEHLRCEHLRSVRRTAADLCQPLSSRLCGLISASHKTSRLSPALGIVRDARQADSEKIGIARICGFDQPSPAAQFNEIADFWHFSP